jgi:hypothetical protein
MAIPTGWYVHEIAVLRIETSSGENGVTRIFVNGTSTWKLLIEWSSMEVGCVEG